MNIPSGVVTLLFTDIQGSTRTWEEFPAQMQDALAAHDLILREAVEAAGGYVFKTVGDAFCVAFREADSAVAAAVAAQRALNAHDWPDPVRIQVRMGLHTGPCVERDRDYFGPTVNRAARLEAVAHGGQVVLSSATRVAVEGIELAGVTLRDLGEHRLKDLAALEQVFQVEAAGLPTDFEPLRSERAGRTGRLPETLGLFVGREREIRDVAEAVTTARVVTVVGAGGVGKTRLAVEVAASVADRFSGGAWLCELAPLPVGSTTDIVAGSMATELDLRLATTEGVLDALWAQLGSQGRLIVLDNCEHLIDTAATVAAEIVRHCPDVVVLATSRAPLDIDGEVVLTVDPLALPDDESNVTASPAVQLFVDRAQRAGRGWVLSTATEAAVADICRRLDGMPLALELAGARVRAMPVDKIAARLNDRFALLGAGRRDAGENQRTLWATIDWSYQLLTVDQQLALRLLAMFDGPFDLESVEQFLDGALETTAPLDALLDLVDHSLVVATPDGYRILETITQFAREHLDSDDEHDQAWERLLHWAQALVPDDYFELSSPQWARIRFHYDTLRALFDWAGATRPELAALAAHLYGYWLWSSRLEEGAQVLRTCLTAVADDDLAPDLMAKLGSLYGDAGDFAASDRYNLEAEALGRERGLFELLVRVGYNRSFDRLRAGRLIEAEAEAEAAIALLPHLPPESYWHSTARTGAIQAALYRGRFARVHQLLDEQAEALVRIDDPGELFVHDYTVGVLALHELHPLEALEVAERAFDAARSIFDQNPTITMEVMCHRILAWCVLGDLERARAEAAELRLTLRGIETTGAIAASHNVLGTLDLSLHDPVAAVADFQAAVRDGITRLHDPANIEGVAVALEHLGDRDRATTLVHAAADARRAMGAPILPLDARLLGDTLATLQSRPRPDLTPTLDEAIAIALSVPIP